MKLGIVSAKGGVGASLWTVGLVLYLGEKETVFLGDGDWGRRSLDLYMGAEPMVYDFYNGLMGKKEGYRKLKERIIYAPASLSKTFSDLTGKTLTLPEEAEHVFIDFSKIRAKDLDPFKGILEGLILISDATLGALMQTEGLYWALRRERWNVEVVVTSVEDTASLDSMIKEKIPRLERYHIFSKREKEELFHEDGTVRSYGREEYARFLENREKGEWENPVYKPKGFWTRIFR